jgi:hypothetical protein
MDSKSIKRWKDTVAAFGLLSDSVWWADGFCLYYYLRTFSKITPASNIYWQTLFYQWSSILFRVIKIFVSLFRKKISMKYRDHIFLTDYNPSYMRSLEPVIEETFRRTENVTILKPKADFFKNRHALQHIFKKYENHSICYEDLPKQYSRLKRSITFLTAVLTAVVDTVRFYRSDIEHKFFFTPTFIKHSIVHRYYRESAALFLKRAKSMTSCNDHHLWESLMYQSTDKNTLTLVLQHGFLGEFTNPLFSDRFLAWSNEDRIKMITELDAEPDRIIAAGSPK